MYDRYVFVMGSAVCLFCDQLADIVYGFIEKNFCIRKKLSERFDVVAVPDSGNYNLKILGMRIKI